MKVLTVYVALAGSYVVGKENVCLDNACAHNVSIFREIPFHGSRKCVSRFEALHSIPIKQTGAPKTAQGCCKNSTGPLPIFSETDEKYLG